MYFLPQFSVHVHHAQTLFIVRATLFFHDHPALYESIVNIQPRLYELIRKKFKSPNSMKNFKFTKKPENLRSLALPGTHVKQRRIHEAAGKKNRGRNNYLASSGVM